MSKRSAAIRGDREQAFTRLFEAHWGTVRSRVELALDADDAGADDIDELVGEVFLLAWKKWDGPRTIGLPWLLTTADNKVRDRHRRSAVGARVMAALVQKVGLSVVHRDDLDRMALHESLDLLTERERRVVMLAYWEKCEVPEIGQELGMSAQAVWTMLSRARKKLRAAIEAKDDESSTVGGPGKRVGGAQVARYSGM